MPMRRVIGVWASCCALALVVACRSGGDVATPEEHREDAARRNQELEVRVAALEKQVAAQAQEMGAVEGRLAEQIVRLEARAGVLPPGVFPEHDPPPHITGTVVNSDVDLKLVQANVGRNAGVRRGFVLDIVRECTYIGRFRVDTVFDDHCAGMVMLLREGQQVQRGDLVTNRLN